MLENMAILVKKYVKLEESGDRENTGDCCERTFTGVHSLKQTDNINKKQQREDKQKPYSFAMQQIKNNLLIELADHPGKITLTLQWSVTSGKRISFLELVQILILTFLIHKWLFSTFCCYSSVNPSSLSILIYFVLMCPMILCSGLLWLRGKKHFMCIEKNICLSSLMYIIKCQNVMFLILFCSQTTRACHLNTQFLQLSSLLNFYLYVNICKQWQQNIFGTEVYHDQWELEENLLVCSMTLCYLQAQW